MLRKYSVTGIILLFLLSSLIPIASSNSSYETNRVYSTHVDENGTLSGYVNDTSMNPIEGAKVRVYFHETYEEDYSDSSGYYHVTNIPICFCLKNATASKDGYTTEWVLLAIGENTTYDFVLTPLDKIYVDDDNTAGPWDGSQEHPYQFIQDGVDNASVGDTVFVYKGIYFENVIDYVIIRKSIVLVGEDRTNIIIDGQNRYIVIYVRAASVTIENFTIRNGTYGVYNDNYKTSISHNIIINNYYGICSECTENVNITGNIIVENNFGIAFCDVQDSVIRYNHILSNKKIGVLFTMATMPGLQSENNSVYYNIIQKNTMGIYLEYSPLNKINCNNFYQNIVDASFGLSSWTNWNHNYWGRPRIFPKPIFGTTYLGLPWFNFDWHPAKEPYDIP